MTLRERIAARVTDIRDRGQRIVQLNLELLASELREKGKKFGTAIGLFVAAGLFSLYAVGFLLATIAVLLALVLPLWASLLIVTAALFALVAVLVLVGRDQLRKIGDPKPEAAIAEAKETRDMMTANVRGTLQSVRERMRPKRPAPAGSPLAEWANVPPPPQPEADSPAPDVGPASEPPAEDTTPLRPSDSEKDA
jgi:hypothetical protein